MNIKRTERMLPNDFIINMYFAD